MEGDDLVLRTGMRLVGSENTTNMLLKEVKEEMGQLESIRRNGSVSFGKWNKTQISYRTPFEMSCSSSSQQNIFTRAIQERGDLILSLREEVKATSIFENNG